MKSLGTIFNNLRNFAEYIANIKIPKGILEAASTTTQYLIPQKSMRRYFKNFDVFIKRRFENRTKCFKEKH